MSLVQAITLLMPTFRRLAILPVAILLRPRAITTTATTGVPLRLLTVMPLILRPLLRDLELRLVDLRLVLVMITNGLLATTLLPLQMCAADRHHLPLLPLRVMQSTLPGRAALRHLLDTAVARKVLPLAHLLALTKQATRVLAALPIMATLLAATQARVVATPMAALQLLLGVLALAGTTRRAALATSNLVLATGGLEAMLL